MQQERNLYSYLLEQSVIFEKKTLIFFYILIDDIKIMSTIAKKEKYNKK